MRSGAIIILGAFIAVCIIALTDRISFALNQQEQPTNVVSVEPDLTIRFIDDTCHGIYTTEKDRGMNSTVWICDSGFVGYDETGTVFPNPQTEPVQ